MAINTIKFLDPSDNVVDYIKEVKPYHTKLGEVIVEYYYNDKIKVTVDEYHHLKIDIVRPAVKPSLGCENDGYGSRMWGDPPRIPVVSPNQQISAANYPAVNLTNNTLTLPGDFTNLFCETTPVSLMSYVENHDYLFNLPEVVEIVVTSPCLDTIYDISVYDECLYDDDDLPTPYRQYYAYEYVTGGAILLRGDYRTVFANGDTLLLINSADGETRCHLADNELLVTIEDLIYETQYGFDVDTYETDSFGTGDAPGALSTTKIILREDVRLYPINPTFAIDSFNIEEGYVQVKGNVTQYFHHRRAAGIAATEGSCVLFVRTIQLVNQGTDLYTRIYVFDTIPANLTSDATITSAPLKIDIVEAHGVLAEEEELKNSFVVQGDKASFFPAMTPVYVKFSTGNDGFYVVSHRGAYYDISNSVTVIPVIQTVNSTTDDGAIFINRQFDLYPYDRFAIQRQSGVVRFRKPWSIFGQYTVSHAIYNHGFIDSWSDVTDPSTYVPGDDPHTIVEIQEPLPIALPENTDNLKYLLYVSPLGISTTAAVSYSNYYRYYDAITHQYIQVPDEGYVTKNIVGIELTQFTGLTPIPGTGKFVVPGDLTRSNIFVGDKLVVSQSEYSNGTYTIFSLAYNYSLDRTTLGVEETIIDDTVDGILRIDTISNALFVTGDHRCCFRQGRVFEVVGGTVAGHYDVVSSDYINGQTRIRVRQNIFSIYHRVGAPILAIENNGFVINSNAVSEYPVGQQFNVVGSPANDGYYFVSSATYDSNTNTTTIIVDTPIDPRALGSIHKFEPGLITTSPKGYSESNDFCNIVQEGLVRVAATTISEDLSFGWGTTYTWNIVSVNQGTNSVCVQGDWSSIIDPSDGAFISGSTGNDGNYAISSVSYNDLTGMTCTTFSSPSLPSSVADGTLKIEDIDISRWYQYIIVYADANEDYFVVQGDASKVIQVGQKIKVVGSPSNDGVYQVLSSPTYRLDTKTTIVYVVEPVHNTEYGGWVEPLRYFQHLANLVLRDRVGIHVIDEVNDIAVTTGGMIVDGWDMPMWDLGAWDESLQQNLHLYGRSFSYDIDRSNF